MLPLDKQQMLREHPVQNLIPWRTVRINNSLSTPCRLVFDASQATASDSSLNDYLLKEEIT